jgi:putative DNA methylase
MAVTPLSLKDAPAIIERLLPVQKLSAESYKEQMAVHGKTLTALGSYWKGRKPLILNKACVLGCLVPATDDPARDLEIFEKLMAMDDESFVARAKLRAKPREILASVALTRIEDYFRVSPRGALPTSAPVDWSNAAYRAVSVEWRADIGEMDRRRLEAQLLPRMSYREMVNESLRPEEVGDAVHAHIWDAVNRHLGTEASSFPELVEQLGIMRYGHRPRVADVFAGSGQVPFEAARLGCEAYAADLSPVACMLTWGAFNLVGGSPEARASLLMAQQDLVDRVRSEIDRLGIESNGNGWRGKVYLYCIEVICPQSGWLVPLLPTRVVSKGYRVVADVVPDPVARRYNVVIRSGVSDRELAAAQLGTVRTDGRGQDPYMIHTVNGTEYKTKISTLRGDHRKTDGSTGNRLRPWEIADFRPRPGDIFGERLYAIEWMRSKKGRGEEYEFRSVTEADLERERAVEGYVASHLAEWQERGWVPDMRIEPGVETERLGRERGWTYWHHLFNSRQLLLAALVNSRHDASLKFGLTQLLNASSRLSRWNQSAGGGGIVAGVFDNQALNTLFNFGARSSGYGLDLVVRPYKSYPLDGVKTKVDCIPADQLVADNDVYVTDPPYGDAVKYEEILEFFIAWLRKNPPAEFADWVWDSRRTLAIAGEDEDFRRGMVAAYSRMNVHMPDNGLHVIMFTHKSGTIWADMANIVWASGLQVTAAWYVVTEADKRIQDAASFIKGTVLLVCRKRAGHLRTTSDELAWDIQEEVETQVAALTGLNQQAKGLYRDENVFEDADIQMAGYAAALRALTRYAVIDGRDMTQEAIRPRVKGEETFVDRLISFAVNTANQALVPSGIEKRFWDKLSGAERFYLKMLETEARGANTLDNYQNFAKAFKVRDFDAFMGDHRANHARLKSAVEFGRGEMSEGSELFGSVLRAVLYAVMELVMQVDGSEVLAHMTLNVPDWYGDVTHREAAVALAGYLARQLQDLRPEEAAGARIVRELILNQRLG